MDRTSRSATVVLFIASIAGCQSSPPSNGGASHAAQASARDPVQVYIDNLRDELRKGEEDIYRQVMAPTPQEAAIFAPIYREYEKELHALNDRRNELIRKFADAFNAGKLDEPTSAHISAEWLEIKARSLDLLKKYNGEISRALSPLQGAQFLQVEHRIATVTDLLIAAGIPMLRLEPVEGSSPPAKQ
jgi:hypothetical protein